MLSGETTMQMVFSIASIFGMEPEKQQLLLEAETRAEALRMVYDHLSHEVQVLELRNKIASEAQSEISSEQREYVLRQQMQAIQEELRARRPRAKRQRPSGTAREGRLPEDIRKEAERELSRLERFRRRRPSTPVTRTYLEFLLELPWTNLSDTSLDMPQARRILDEDHFGLEGGQGADPRAPGAC